jgi:hypothetical protein
MGYLISPCAGVNEHNLTTNATQAFATPPATRSLRFRFTMQSTSPVTTQATTTIAAASSNLVTIDQLIADGVFPVDNDAFDVDDDDDDDTSVGVRALTSLLKLASACFATHLYFTSQHTHTPPFIHWALG